MKEFPLVQRALQKASGHTMWPVTEILRHLNAATDFGDRLSEQTLKGHLEQARQHAEMIVESIKTAQLEVDRACRSGTVTVVPIGDGDPALTRTLALVGREMATREVAASS